VSARTTSGNFTGPGSADPVLNARDLQYMLIVGAVALAAALVMVFGVFKAQSLVDSRRRPVSLR